LPPEWAVLSHIKAVSQCDVVGCSVVLPPEWAVLSHIKAVSQCEVVGCIAGNVASRVGGSEPYQGCQSA